MKRKSLYLFLLFSLLISQSVGAQQTDLTPTLLRLGGAESPEAKAWVEERLAQMTLKEKIGQLFIHTVDPQNNEATRNNLSQAIKEYKIGGLLFSGGQVAAQVSLTNYAQSLATTPLLITFDGEWGLAMRLKGTPTFPRNRVLGAIQDDKLLYEYGKEVARQCREIGVQVNFAPVADVDNNPRNPVINTRSFGGDPSNVANKVIAYARGLEAGGVLSVSKHFPGHGDTEVDSHKALPLLSFNRDRLEQVELYPFKKVIEARLGGIMVGHLHVPALGKEPASISEEVIEGVLCKELGYQGLVFTDAMEMKGIASIENVTVKALKAGNDLLLVKRNLSRELKAVLAGVERGEISEAAITAKCRKVLSYKYALGLQQAPSIQQAGIENRLHTPQSEALILELFKASATLLGNSKGVVPLAEGSSGNTLLQVGSASNHNPLYERLKQSISLDRVVAGGQTAEVTRQKLHKSRRVIAVVSTTLDDATRNLLLNLPTQTELILLYTTPLSRLAGLEPLWRKAAAVLIGNSAMTQVQYHLADILLGKSPVDGRLPIAIGQLYQAGDGVTLQPGKSQPQNYLPEDYGMSSSVLQQIDAIAREGIAAKAYPGCQILILKDGVPVYQKAFGSYTYESAQPVTNETLYDLASVTKVAGTVLAVMKLYDEGKIGLTDRASAYIPLLRGTDKERITIEQLLAHQSGLQAFFPFYRNAIDTASYKGAFLKARREPTHRRQVDAKLFVVNDFTYQRNLVSITPQPGYDRQIGEKLFAHHSFGDSILAKIVSLPLKPPTYRYSCLNFILLKEVVESISGISMDQFLEQNYYHPLGLQHTSFNPLHKVAKEQIAPTTKSDYLRNDALLQGYVHDEAAAFLGGVSGNAGLFSNAAEVGTLFQLLLNEGVYNEKRYLSQETCNFFLNYRSKISRRGLGFDRPDVRNPAKSPCAEEASPAVVGHTGFTGTCAWADPTHRLVYVFLCNRVYPRAFDHKALTRLGIRTRIQQLMYQSIKAK
ncbi:MAG: glycoside hydrolase family 3 N-terminal domain-containing protein [Phocaeicola sp.]